MPNMRLEPFKPGDGQVQKPGHEPSCISGFLQFIFENKWFTFIAGYVSVVLFIIYYAGMIYVC